MNSLATLVILVCVSCAHGWWLWGTKEKCYDIYGTNECFSTAAPFDNTDNKAPESPEHQNVKFHLFTLSKPTSAKLLCGTDTSCLTTSTFDASKNTRVITHGYRDEFDNKWIKTMTAELLKYDGSNVIVVDWKDGADNNFLNYLQSAANTRVVGALLTKIISQIVNNYPSVNYASFHLIGHSLGAHVSAEAGRRLNGQLGRITGMDPAGPGFGLKDKKVRLDETDAQFVDAIHTDGEKLQQGGFGSMTEMGDADFYPNGGKNQPGCSDKVGEHVIALFLGGVGGISDSVACSHMRVLALFTESINSDCKFTAYPCSSLAAIEGGTCPASGTTARMGFHAESSARGKYYLTTNSKSPFCKS